MKTIGLIGGMSWHSSAEYYRLINEGIQQQLGGLHSARIIVYSVEFAEIHRLQHEGSWDKAGAILAGAAQKLQQAGADFILIGTNTMHICAPQVEAVIDIPLLHIADATAEAILQQGMRKVGLLGTAFTMQMDYYKSRLIDKGLQVIVPDEVGCELVNRVIFDELCFGDIRSESRIHYLKIIDELTRRGAECVIEGCTEISLLVKQADTGVRLFDTTTIHAQAAVKFALSEQTTMS
jgi:aspartate racemase